MLEVVALELELVEELDELEGRYFGGRVGLELEEGIALGTPAINFHSVARVPIGQLFLLIRGLIIVNLALTYCLVLRHDNFLRIFEHLCRRIPLLNVLEQEVV